MVTLLCSEGIFFSYGKTWNGKKKLGKVKFVSWVKQENWCHLNSFLLTLINAKRQKLLESVQMIKNYPFQMVFFLSFLQRVFFLLFQVLPQYKKVLQLSSVACCLLGQRFFPALIFQRKRIKENLCFLWRHCLPALPEFICLNTLGNTA